ncbi:MAG: hypothetical protein RBR68_08335, partial [Tenuifilaceae bacterium]|nr:hypothetical protein [Tenuifilaceae bacterium]
TKRTVEWEVKIDYFLNKYVECNTSKSRAYFKVDQSMLYFTHFEGDRKSLLYHFYLAAFKVCFAYYKELQIVDSYPINMVFSPNQHFIHDFIAPFTQYMKGKYSLSYIGAENPLAETQITLNATTSTLVFNNEKNRIATSIFVDNTGLSRIEVDHKKTRYTAKRLEYI